MLLLFIVLLILCIESTSVFLFWFVLGFFFLLCCYIYIGNTNIFLKSYCTHFFCCYSSSDLYLNSNFFFWSSVLNFSIPSSEAKRILLKKLIRSYVIMHREGVNKEWMTSVFSLRYTFLKPTSYFV